VNPLTLTSFLSLFNPYTNITSQNSLQLLFCYYSLQIFLFICNLNSWPPCGSTPVLPGYLLLWHSCTWDKTSTLWSCQLCLSLTKSLLNPSSLLPRKGPSGGGMLVWVHASFDPSPILFDSGSRLQVLTGLQKLYASHREFGCALKGRIEFMHSRRGSLKGIFFLSKAPSRAYL